MNNIGGKGATRTVEIIKKIETPVGVSPTAHENLAKQVQHLEKKRPEVTQEQVKDIVIRMEILERQVKALQEGFIEVESDTGEARRDIQILRQRIITVESKPAQVVSTITVEKPGVTVHENVLIPCTSKWVWVVLGAFAIAQASQLWRLL